MVRLTINPVVSQNFGIVASGTSFNLNAVAFSSALIGVAVGEGGTILRSVDGGQSWAPVISGTVARLRTVAFGGRGVVAGANGLLFTADSGATWTPTLAGDSGVCCTSVAYADALTVVASYRNGFLRSTDGGQSFGVGFSATVFNPLVRFGSATHGAVADGRILYTTDGGANWPVATQPPAVGATTLAFASSSIAVAGGDRKSVV